MQMRIESYLKGRVRVVFEAFHGFFLNKEALGEVHGIKKIQFNPRRASLLIEFDEDHLSLDNLLGQLQALSKSDLFRRLPRIEAQSDRGDFQSAYSHDNPTGGDLILR
ncbi:MAG: hypothetical protein QXT86_10945, partial [Archaeoglobaceae archaeon]